MKITRKVLKFILPRSLFDRIEGESKKWFIECGECGFSKSYWEAGGFRAYALKRKKIFGYCPVCKKYRLFDVRKRD